MQQDEYLTARQIIFIDLIFILAEIPGEAIFRRPRVKEGFCAGELFLYPVIRERRGRRL